MAEPDRTEAGQGSAGENADERDETADAQEPGTLEERLEEALREVAQFRELSKRAQADLVNYKRRVEEEKTDIRKYEKSRILLNTLPIVDDFERALSMVPDGSVASGWLEGLELVARKLQQLLEMEGVKKIDAQGVQFTPTEHEAVAYEEAPDGVEEGIVVSVVREGYKLNDRILRASQVTVARAKETE